MKYTVEIYEKGIAPVALSDEELKEYEVVPTGAIHLYSIYTNGGLNI